jgi:hypothetical protein
VIPIRNHRTLLFPDRTGTNLAPMLCHRSIQKFLNRKNSDALPTILIDGSFQCRFYTGGRIHADIEQARADLARQEAEYEDLEAR